MNIGGSQGSGFPLPGGIFLCFLGNGECIFLENARFELSQGKWITKSVGKFDQVIEF